MRPKKPMTSLAVTCSALFVGAAILHGQSNTAVADAAVSIGFQNSGGATVGGGVSISFQSGGIIVTTNLPAATFIITGAATFTGSGTSGSFPNAPPGQYTIAFGDLVGYVTPNTQTQTLAVGGTITFNGTYISVQPSLGVSPTALTFTYQQGILRPPSPQNVTVSSSGAALNFTAAASTVPPGGTWLSVSPAGGTTGSPTGTLSVSVAGGLTAATYNGQITITAAGTVNSPLPVPVTLTVTPPTQAISLTFPVPSAPKAYCPNGQCSPYTVGIASVFDHLTSKPYGVDGAIQSYTGATATNSYGPGDPTSFQTIASSGQVGLSWSATVGAALYELTYIAEPSGYPLLNNLCVPTLWSGTSTSYTHTGLQNGTRYAYRLCIKDSNGDVNAGLTVSATPPTSGSTTTLGQDDCLTYKQSSGAAFTFGINGNYRGARACGSSDYLTYDGHPGYDYPFPYSGTTVQAVYAATAGTVSYVNTPGYVHPGNYHVLGITPTNNKNYRVYHLHLSSYYCAAMAAPDCPQLPNVVYPAVIQRLPNGIYQSCLGPDGKTPCPKEGVTVSQGQFIGYVGNYEYAWGGVGPHLHFEVRKKTANGYMPVDPYKWLGSGPDPYALAPNVPLWQQAPPGQ